MSLRDQLKELLPQILPADPNDAIKGTELIRLVKFQLRQDYSDASLRYHFSIMSCDPSAPIAKVAHGQGYYLRPDSRGALGGSRHLIAFRQQTMADLLGRSPVEISRELLHAGKFRAIVQRFLEGNQRSVFFFDDAFASGAPAENVWRFPDAAVVDWPAGEAAEGGLQLNPAVMRWRRMLHAPLFRLTALKLRLRVTHESAREEFFQCISQGEWTHASEFFLAMPVDDASLADLLADLGQRYGVGVMSFGFPAECLDDLPDADAIPQLQASEFDAVLARAQFNRLSAPESRRQLDWPMLDSNERDSEDLRRLIAWVESAIESGHPRPVRPDLP